MTPQPPQQPDPRNIEPRLSDADARLLDLLIEQGPAALPADDPRAQRLLAIWQTIGHWPVEDPRSELAPSTVRAIAAQALTSNTVVAGSSALSPADAQAVEAWLDLRRTAETRSADASLTPENGERLLAVRGLFALLDQAHAQPAPADLAERTLSRVAVYRSAQPSLQLVGTAADAQHTKPGRIAMSVGLRRFGSAAAVVTLCLSVLLPVLSKSHNDAQALACQDNLREAGQGLASYSVSNDGHLPQDTANTFSLLSRFAADSTRQSPADAALPASQINLFLLPKQGYATADQLVCPATDPGQVGNYYNAQNALAAEPIRLADIQAPMLADNNPLYRLTANGLVRVENLPDQTASANHNAAGQNVLYRDGSARWHIKPTVNHHDRADNLWLKDAKPGEPDAFLTP